MGLEVLLLTLGGLALSAIIVWLTAVLVKYARRDDKRGESSWVELTAAISAVSDALRGKPTPPEGEPQPHLAAAVDPAGHSSIQGAEPTRHRIDVVPSGTAATRRAATPPKPELERRHAELAPRIHIGCEPCGSTGGMRMAITLTGPPDLERLDKVVVTICNDYNARSEVLSTASGPYREMSRQLWSRWRFVPGPGVSSESQPGGLGRKAFTDGLAIGETLQFVLEPTPKPVWWEGAEADWRNSIACELVLALQCSHNGWKDSWRLDVLVPIDPATFMGSADEPDPRDDERRRRHAQLREQLTRRPDRT